MLAVLVEGNGASACVGVGYGGIGRRLSRSGGLCRLRGIGSEHG